MYPTGFGVQGTLFAFGPYSGGISLEFVGFGAQKGIRLYNQSVGAQVLGTLTANYYNNWSHVALVRSAGVTNLYLNGAWQGSTSASYDINDTTSSLWIGNDGSLDSGVSFGGNITSFRWTKGNAIYTSNFTPPSYPLTALTGTELLLNTSSASGITTDDSGYNRTVVNDNVSFSVCPATPTPTQSPSVTPSPTPSPTPSESPSGSPSPTPSPSATITPQSFNVWGANSDGQAGNNSVVNFTSPNLWRNNVQYKKVSYGRANVAYIDNNDNLWVSGINSQGSIGNNNTVNKSSPVQTLAGGTWKYVAAGYTMLAIKTDGTLWGWGYNYFGNIGNGNTNSASSPVQISALTNWVSCTSSVRTSYAINSLGQMYVWGTNCNGTFGTNTNGNTALSPIMGPTNKSWTQVSGASYCSTIALATDGTVWTWGGNYRGFLGNNSVILSSTPVQVGSATNWTKVSAGYYHAMAMKNDGTMWAWGDNSYGQLGRNNIANASSPIQIVGTWLDGNAFYGNTCGIKSNGTLWACGDNSFNQLPFTGANRSSMVQAANTATYIEFVTINDQSFGGIARIVPPATATPTPTQSPSVTPSPTPSGTSSPTPSVTPSPTPSPSPTIQPTDTPSPTPSPTPSESPSGSPSPTPSPSATITPQSFNVWGANSDGQAGNNSVVNFTSPNLWRNNVQYKKVSYGRANVAYIDNNDNLWVSGINSQGSIGNNNTVNKSSPVQTLAGGTWKYVAAGYTMLAIKTDGTLWGWGYNYFGNIGNGNTNSASSPVQISALTNWVSCTSSVRTSYAINSLGQMYVWGTNCNGTFGTNTNGNTALSPIMGPTNKSWTQVSGASYCSTIALATDGTVWTWGGNYRGFLGNNSVILSSTPVQVGSATNWTKVSAGYYHAMAMKNDGTMWAWGDNSYGQLGRNNIANASSPIQIVGTWLDGNAFYGNTCGIKSNGTLWACGDNSFNQLPFTGANRSSMVQAANTATYIEFVTINDQSFGGIARIVPPATATPTPTQSPSVTPSPTPSGTSSPTPSVTPSPTPSPTPSGTQPTSTPSPTPSESASLTTPTPTPTIGTLSAWWGWGSNTGGSQAIGNTNVVTGLYNPQSSDFTQIAIGTAFFGLKADNTLWVCGTNTSGQLGLVDIINLSSMVQASGSWIRAISNVNLSSGIKADGTLWTWGNSTQGSAGINVGTTTSLSSPVQEILGKTDWVTHFIGSASQLAVDSAGKLWTVGSDSNGNQGLNTLNVAKSRFTQIGTGTDWSSTYVSNAFSAALKTNGSVYVWGINTVGQIGDGTVISKSSPVQVVPDKTISKIVGSSGGIILLDTSGNLWGTGQQQLGLNDITPRSSYTQVASGVLDACANGSNILFIKTDNTLWGVGAGGSPLLNASLVNVSSPIMLNNTFSWQYFNSVRGTFQNQTFAYANGLPQATPTVTASPTPTPTPSATPEVLNWWGWGSGANGQFANNKVSNINALNNFYPASVYADVAIGNNGLFKKTDGTLWQAGLNTDGRLGINSITNVSSQIQITGAIFGSFGIANIQTRIFPNGTLWSAGQGNLGGLANNSIVNQSSPVQESLGKTDWVESFGFSGCQVALDSAGRFWSCGLNNSGQIGQNDLINRSQFVQIGAATNWVDVTVSATNFIAKKNDNTYWTCGSNTSGQFGRNNVISASSPIQIGSAYTIQKITGGQTLTFILDNVGNIWGTGANGSGTLGDGTTVSKSSFVQMLGGPWIDVIPCATSLFMIKSDNTLWAVGAINANLSLNTFANAQSSPVMIDNTKTWLRFSEQPPGSISMSAQGVQAGFPTPTATPSPTTSPAPTATPQPSFGPLSCPYSAQNFYFSALSVPNGGDYTMGTGDFTVEWWQNSSAGALPPSSESLDQFVFDINNGQFSFSEFLEGPYIDPQFVTFNFYAGGTSYSLYSYNIYFGGTMLYGNWFHFALVRKSGVVTLYINGLAQGTATVTTNLTDTSTLYIGDVATQTFGAYNSFKGTITNFRIVKGTAVYASNFSVPTAPLSNVSGCTLLMQVNSSPALLTDSSSLAKTVTNINRGSAVSYQAC